MVRNLVSMPCLGLSPFLRSPLGTRINRGHNLETIHVIVRQFSFAPIFTPFFPSLGIPALFRLKWFVFRHFYYTCFFIPAQGIFAFSGCFSISVSWSLIFPFPYCHKRHPFGCLCVISYPCFSGNFISFVSIIPPTVSSYFLHHENSFLHLSPLRHFLFL